MPHDNPRRGKLAAQGNSPGQPVENGDRKAGGRIKQVLSVNVEGTRVGHGHRQFTQAEHDGVNQDRPEEIGDNRADGSGLADGIACFLLK